MRARLRLAPETDSQHARMAATTLLGAPWNQARLPRWFDNP